MRIAKDVSRSPITILQETTETGKGGELSTKSLSSTDFPVRARPARFSLYGRLKRGFDLCVAVPGLLLAAPLIFLLGAAVKLTSRGPVFYRQERVGLNGKPFVLIKLRTMYEDAEADGPRWCEEADCRITPVGRFMRRLHLDELPQLLNVIRGEMALVGPRPERPCFVQDLKRTIPLYERRLAVKPGLTGLAQIRHHSDRSIEDVQTKLGYDLEYMKRPSLWLDLQILARTVVEVIVRPDGSL